MRHYEVMIVLAPDQAEDGFNKHLDRCTKIIEDGGGTIVNDDRWGIRTLAYPIKKYDQGFYTVIEWEGPPELLTDLDHTLRLEEKVLRHMVVHLDSTALAELAEARAKRAERPVDDVEAPDDAEDDAEDGAEDDAEDDADGDDTDAEVAVPDDSGTAVDTTPEAEPETEPETDEAASESSDPDASVEADTDEPGEADADDSDEVDEDEAEEEK